MSDFDSDPTEWQDEGPDLDDPTLDEPSADELDDPELNEAEADADEVDPDLDASLDDSSDPLVEPGAEGPEGTGIEGADDALIEDAGWEDETEAPDISDEFSTDPVAAAEQGNRPGDEMVSEGDDDAEVAELDGDDLDVDALSDDPLDEL